MAEIMDDVQSDKKEMTEIPVKNKNVSDEKKEETKDYLDEDPIIESQKYVCMSFMSSKNVKREDHFEKIFSDLEPSLMNVFKPFMGKKLDESNINDVISSLKSLLHENRKLLDEKEDKEKFQGGVKFRGAFPTPEDAETRAKMLSAKYDPNFHIFRGEGFKWVPFNPDPDKVDGQEYYEKELNDLMKATKDELADKKQTETERKKKLMSEAKEVQKGIKKENKVKERLQKKLAQRKLNEKAKEEIETKQKVDKQSTDTDKLIETVNEDEKKLIEEKRSVTELTQSLQNLQKACDKLKTQQAKKK